ncbi:MAG: tetratricopeptide repeat protein, partial [Nitrososphaerota archaeon]
VSIPVSFFLREGNTPATLVVILALIAYIGYVGYTIWAGMRVRRAVAWTAKGVELLNLNRYEDVLTNEEALANFEKALTLNPQSMRAWFGKGIALVRLGNFTESIEICDRVLASYPHDALVLTVKGRALLRLQRFNEALAVLESALRIDAENAESLDLIIITLIRLRRYDEALDNVTYALTVFPADPYFWHNRASLLSDDLKRYDEALAVCDAAISRGVTLPNMWAIKGDALRALRQETEAIAAYMHVLTLSCSDFYDWTARGRALMGLRRYDEALAAYDKALAIQSISVRTWRKKAEVLRALGREAEAQEAEQRAEALER